MKNYKKKTGFTFALALICSPNGSTSYGSNDNYSGTKTRDSFDSRPDFLGNDSRTNDPKSYDNHSGANDNTRSNAQVNTTPTPPPTPALIAPRRPQQQ
ncbi:MAG: hypothetical protein ACRYGR_02835 [Janthinobacterium lividum]